MVIIALGVFLVSPKKVHAILLLSIVFFGAGVARMHSAIPTDTLETTGVEQEVVFSGRVYREPDVRDTSTNLFVIRDDTQEKILVRISSYKKVNYADTIHVSGVLETPENFEGENGRIFNYRSYLAKDGIHNIVAFPKIDVVSSKNTPTGFLLTAKQAYLSALKRVLPEPAAALAGGITVGERRSLGDELTQDFRDTGLVHIVVLSGYNIAIIVIFIVALLSSFPKRLRYTLAIFGIVAFTILVGASATVVRASIMGSIGALGTVVGRTYDALYTLAIAGFGMLLWNPYLLMYDPSFQLSFVATVGLLVGAPLLTPFLSFVPDRYGLREICVATIATQIAVLPLLVYMVGDVSLVAIFVNLLVLPVIPIAMLFVFFTGIAGTVFTPVGILIGSVAYTLLSYVIFVVRFFADIPFAIVSVPAFPFWMTFLFYILLIGGVWYLKRKTS